MLVLEFLWPHIFMVPLQCAGEWYSSFYSLHKSAECHSTYALFFVRDGHRTYAKFTCYKIMQHLARSHQNMISKMCSIIIVTSKKK